MTLGAYRIDDIEDIPSPAVVVFEPLVEANLDRTIALTGGPERLRPHCKTHKTYEVIKMWLRRGVNLQKCATLREAQMCIEAGCRDVIIAYQLIGPMAKQVIRLAQAFPEARITSLADTPEVVEELGRSAHAAGVRLGVMVDLDLGLHRTGIAPEEAFDLCTLITKQSNLWFAGLHNYDAHNRSPDPAVRERAVVDSIHRIEALTWRLHDASLEVPEILCGGSATAHFYAQRGLPYRGSPGTTVFWDHGYASRIPDLEPLFTPAALILGRVISKPLPDYLTLDVGNKAIASDPPIGQRGLIIGLEDAVTHTHNEEHWTIQSLWAYRYNVGSHVLIVPEHICPCTNLHPVLYVVDARGKLSGSWKVVARQRSLDL